MTTNGKDDPPPTDPRGFDPPVPPLDLLESMVRRVFREEFAAVRRDLADHQLEELAHHERLDDRLKRMEHRIEALELADTEPPDAT